MQPDTPLAEVARHLPQDAAKVLTEFPIPVQESVLRMMRTAIWSLERRQHTLDPVELDAVLDVYIGTITPLVSALYERGPR